LTAIAALVAVSTLAAPAAAVNHLIAIDEVLGSWQGDDTVQFVELRLLAPGQTSLSDGGGSRGAAEIIFDDASGSAATRRFFTFTHDLANGETGARVLLATPALALLTGLKPDFVLPAGMLAPHAGRVCYAVNPPQGGSQPTGVINCVAYGAFTGDNGTLGPPTPVTPDNRSLQRVAMSGSMAADWAGALQPTPETNAGDGATLQTLCGDGNLSQGEECDGGALGGKTCADFDQASGDLLCDQCHFDARQCSTCGNDAINGREECDGVDLGGRTCTSLGFTGGTLSCTDTCHVSTATCDPTFFVPGGGPAGPECFAEWQVKNGSTRPGVDGKAPVRQRCKDGDAGCDADPTAGRCVFTVAVCLNHADPRLARNGRACKLVSIGSWTLLAPSSSDEAGAALLAAVGAIAPSTVDGGTVSFAPAIQSTEKCSAAVQVVVATRGARPGTKVLKSRTAAVGGKPRDADTLKLVCAP
jgi:hypothetical protein